MFNASSFLTVRFARPVVVGFVMAVFMGATLASSAYALWPFGGDDSPEVPLSKTATTDQAVIPPDENYKERECEPLRQKAVELNQTMASWNPIREIRVSSLKRKHRKCIRKFEDQEYAYLKRARMGKENLPAQPPESQPIHPQH